MNNSFIFIDTYWQYITPNRPNWKKYIISLINTTNLTHHNLSLIFYWFPTFCRLKQSTIIKNWPTQTYSLWYSKKIFLFFSVYSCFAVKKYYFYAWDFNYNPLDLKTIWSCINPKIQEICEQCFSTQNQETTFKSMRHNNNLLKQMKLLTISTAIAAQLVAQLPTTPKSQVHFPAGIWNFKSPKNSQKW